MHCFTANAVSCSCCCFVYTVDLVALLGVYEKLQLVDVQVLSNIQSRTGYRLDLYSLRSFKLVLRDAALTIRDDNVSAKSVRKMLLARYRPKPDALALIMQISRSLIHGTEPPSLSRSDDCVYFKGR